MNFLDSDLDEITLTVTVPKTGPCEHLDCTLSDDKGNVRRFKSPAILSAVLMKAMLALMPFAATAPREEGEPK